MNFLILVFDSLSSLDLNSSQAKTLNPHIDSLSSKSADFQQAFTPCPQSSPARASLFTGLDPFVHGLWTNGVTLPASPVTFPQILRHAGYDSWLIGRWQLAGVSNWTTEHIKPDIFNDIQWAHGPVHRSRQNVYLSWLAQTAPQQYQTIFPAQPDPDNALVTNEQRLAMNDLPDELSFNHWVGAKLVQKLSKAEPDKPFVGVASFVVGDSMGAQRSAEDDQELLNLKALQQADTAIGTTLKCLDEQGLSKNTVVILSAARGNGKSTGTEEPKLDGLMQEQFIRVPLLISGPGIAHQEIKTLVSTIDIAPAIVSLAKVPGSSSMQGESLFSILSGVQPSRDWALSRLRSVRQDGRLRMVSTLRTRHLKLLVLHGDPSAGTVPLYRLYDLQKDPEEQHDLAADEAYENELESMMDIMLDARCALEDRTEPRIAEF